MTSNSTFESIGCSSWICKQMKKLGLKSPTAIQEKCIPEIVSNNYAKDVS